MSYDPLGDYLQAFPDGRTCETEELRQWFRKATPEERARWLASYERLSFAWADMFPEAMLDGGRAGQIDAEVKHQDIDAWALTIEKYLGNWVPQVPRDYNPRKIANVIGTFRGFKKGNYGADRQFNNGISYKDARAIEARERLEQARQLASRISEG